MAIQALSLFPTYALPRLGRSRGRKWSRLVKRVGELPETHPEYMAYTLMLRRLSHQMGQRHNALCFNPGCVNCAQDLLDRYRGREGDLMQMYRDTLSEVQVFMAGMEHISLAA